MQGALSYSRRTSWSKIIAGRTKERGSGICLDHSANARVTFRAVFGQLYLIVFQMVQAVLLKE